MKHLAGVVAVPGHSIRGPINITEFLLPSFQAFRPKSSGSLYFLSTYIDFAAKRFVQIPHYSHCKYFVILCTSFFNHGQNLEPEKSLSTWVTLGPDPCAGFNMHALRAYSHTLMHNRINFQSIYFTFS